MKKHIDNQIDNLENETMIIDLEIKEADEEKKAYK
jgi:hypothetical protein